MTQLQGHIKTQDASTTLAGKTKILGLFRLPNHPLSLTDDFASLTDHPLSLTGSPLNLILDKKRIVTLYLITKTHNYGYNHP